jgi:preprotein translocase subunit YajC
MNFLIDSAWAQSAPAQQGNPLMTFLPLVLIFIVFYFMLIRPQSKRAKEHRTMLAALAPGDEVVTGGGILGRITEMGESFITVEVANGVELKVQKAQVIALMPKGTLKSA